MSKKAITNNSKFESLESTSSVVKPAKQVKLVVLNPMNPNQRTRNGIQDSRTVQEHKAKVNELDQSLIIFKNDALLQKSVPGTSMHALKVDQI